MWLWVWQLQHNLCYGTCPKLGSIASRANLFPDTFSNSFSADVVVCLTISAASAQPLLLNVSEIRVQTLRASTVFRTRSVTASLLMWLCLCQSQHNVRFKRFARQPFSGHVQQQLLCWCCCVFSSFSTTSVTERVRNLVQTLRASSFFGHVQ